jgi:hypothetical protein
MTPATKTTQFDNLINGHPMRPTPITKPTETPMPRDLDPKTRAEACRIFRAWLFDRAEQYEDSSGIRSAFDELMQRVRDGEPFAAYDHGELDDILARMNQARAIEAK